MVVLATKVYVSGDARDRTLDSLDSLVANDLGDLDVEWTIGLRDDGFPSVTVQGADATAARNVLREEWGAITPHRDVGETYVGTLEHWDEDGFVLDAGEPVRVGANELGLGSGSPSQIRTRFGLVQHMPLRFIEPEAGKPAALADAERDRLYDWTRAEMGRVNVNSATRAEVRATVNRSGHAEDIVTVERLGLLEQSIICTPETDPPGLLSDIGPHLPSEMLCVIP
ncbi:DUF2110 family protein [Halorarius litoreus]|uniref:DUF2110 family protein n=1 Tax=Halorarius litoreus TaxID=2962676 RepID=UPI0020CFD447|nr:DUF2110 family protein [Halorarius litoreus]